MHTFIISFTKFECMTDYNCATAINGNTVYLHMHRDNLAIQQLWKKCSLSRIFHQLLTRKRNCRHPKQQNMRHFSASWIAHYLLSPVDDGSLSDVDKSSVVSHITEETERLDPGGTCMLRRGRSQVIH